MSIKEFSFTYCPYGKKKGKLVNEVSLFFFFFVLTNRSSSVDFHNIIVCYGSSNHFVIYNCVSFLIITKTIHLDHTNYIKKKKKKERKRERKLITMSGY
ncbi:uncharacterized protein BX664DRAFT_340163 [Halteromyces radiatus]|uniref:uncharacterized protein n=1 Tax=Halteromyces radiatus TaxID=101107 RepID=UPI002220EF1E|nr:uncharacterized protein BX664DRAFT_340163 [Halteromyces radiatus]KAI8081339.1 hypothetical protein BX664DRAFT_340163 [Halteromyces radiatus]